MSKFGCVCGYTIVDQTDNLPYKAHIREDEDTQKPIELLVDVLTRLLDARQQGRQAEFIRQFELSRGAGESYAEGEANALRDNPLEEVLFHVIFPFWNNYDRPIYECEQCGRLWLQLGTNHRNIRWVSYLPEADERHVLWSQHNHNPYGDLDE